MYKDKNEVKKLGVVFRFFSGFIMVVSLLAFFSALFFAMPESFLGGSIGMLVSALLLYIFSPILFTGYPPKLFMWASGEKLD